MRLEIPKVVVRVDLGEYAPELKGQAFYVWVNPTLDILRKHNELVKENDGDGLNAWYAVIWSQGENGTRWTVVLVGLFVCLFVCFVCLFVCLFI